MIESILTALGGVIAAVLVFLGARFTAKQSSKVNDRSVAVTEWRGLIDDLKQEIARLNDRVNALEIRGSSDRQRIDDLEAELRTAEVHRHALIGYVREVLTWAHLIAPGHTAPPAPAIFVDELNNHL